jgi:hypothetical protein
MIEFALTSTVLLLLIGGVVDIGRGGFAADVLGTAAREGVRHGIWLDASSGTNPYLYDAAIKSLVDLELTNNGLPASTLKNPGTTCPSTADGNLFHNQPYVSSAYPSTAGQVWLFICYTNSPGADHTSSPTGLGGTDLNVILTYAYGALTPVINSSFGNLRLSANLHMTVQG